MYRFHKILVAVDGDRPAWGLLSRAARLAKQNDASIRLVAVVDQIPWYARLVLPDAERVQAHIVRDEAEALSRTAESLGRDGVDASTCVLQGRRHIEVVREAIRGGHDLMMKEAEPNAGVMFGSTDMHLLRSCPCPLWLFKPEHVDRSFTKILAAVDPAPPSDETDVLDLKAEPGPKDRMLDAKILELADSLADERGAEIHVVHAWSAPGEALLRGDPMLAPDQVERYIEDSRAEARKALSRLVLASPDGHGHRSVHLLRGDPADAIVGFARERGVDLIVMGTVARTGIPGLLIGNTAESVLQRVDCSVLAVKPDGFVSPVAADDGAPPVAAAAP